MSAKSLLQRIDSFGGRDEEKSNYKSKHQRKRSTPLPSPVTGVGSEFDKEQSFICDVEVQVTALAVSLDPEGLAIAKAGIVAPFMEFSSQGQKVCVEPIPESQAALDPDSGGVLLFAEAGSKFTELIMEKAKGITLKFSLKTHGDDEGTVALGNHTLKGDMHEYLGLGFWETDVALVTTDRTSCAYQFTITFGIRVTKMVAQAVPGLVSFGPPNLIYLTICSAKDLTNNKDEESLDPYVKLTYGDWSAQTSKKPTTSEPAWNERFAILIQDQSKPSPLKITVWDHNMFSDVLIGELMVDMEALTNPKVVNEVMYRNIILAPKGESTLDGGSTGDAVYLGEMRIKILPKYAGENPDLSTFNQGELDFEVDGGKGEGYEVLDNEEEDEDFTPEEIEAERKRLEDDRLKLEEEMKRIEAIKIQEGSYTFMVHVIEVRELVSKDSESGNDPVVVINCFGQEQTSKIMKDTNACVFDDLFYFELKDQTRDDLEAGVIRVSVMDSDMILRDNLIGSFQTDFEYVYFRDNHELYRQWVALSNSLNDGDTGLQGYMLLSITVLGPGDRPPYHDRKRELQEELKKAGIKEGELQNVSALMPHISQKLHFLVVTVYMGVDIPPLDSLLGRNSIDAYVLVKFADSDPIRTRVVEARDKGHEGGRVTVTWSQQLYIPIQVPTMTNRIEISVWDKDITTPDIVGTCSIFSFKGVQKKTYEKPFWAPLYGATLESSLLSNKDEKYRQGTRPREAVASRGRLLMSMHEDMNEGRRKKVAMVYKKMLKKEKITPQTPEERRMLLRCAVYSGSELPAQKGLGSHKLSIRAMVSRHSASTDARVFSETASGVIHWNKTLTVPQEGGPPLLLPVDPKQIPDVFIYLVRGRSDPEVIAFTRFKAEDVLKLGFSMEPRWVHLSPDKAVHSDGPSDFAGSVLLRLGFGPEEAAPDWGIITMGPPKPVRLNVYLYMGRDLCPSDDSGLLDPYAIVQFNGQRKMIKRVKKTRNPNWFDSVCFDTYLTEDPLRWPVIQIRCMDHDKSPLDKDDWVGTARVPASEIRNRFNMRQVMGRKLAKPRWYKLQLDSNKEAMGELLMNFELITKDKETDNAPSPSNIEPVKEKCVIEVIPIGLRGLRQKGLVPINRPYVEVRVGDEQRQYLTDVSNKPSRTNPNFRADRIRIETRLPSNHLLAPCLNISAFDRQLGGLTKPLLGTATIPLSTRYKGTPDYKVPGGTPYASNPFLEEKDTTIPTPFIMEDQGPEESKTSEGHKPQKRGSFLAAMTRMGLRKTQPIGEEPMPSQQQAHGVLKKKESLVVAGAPGSEFQAIPKFLVGKDRLHSELEWSLSATPFEEFALFRGKKIAGYFDTAFQKVGYFKAMVRVVRMDRLGNEITDPFPCSRKDLIRPQALQVRLYVLKAFRLRAQDTQSNKADPYVKVELGKEKISRREAAITGEINDVPLLQYFELKCKFPGSSKLQVHIYDRDPLGSLSDDHIGTTIIDLEDRWFSKEWQEKVWDKTDPNKPILRTPAEMRSLWNPTCSGPQGSLELWLDILTAKDVSRVPPADISPPPKSKFQLRVIIYKVKDWQLPGDSFTGMTDMYIRGKLGNDLHWQVTDTHLRAQTRASFNWRFVFDMEMPMRKEGCHNLHLQIWDFDLLSNDMLLETSFSLESFINRGYTANAPINFFEEVVVKPQGIQKAYEDARGYAETARSTVNTARANFNNAAGAAVGTVGNVFNPLESPEVPKASRSQPLDIETGDGDNVATEYTALLRESSRDVSSYGIRQRKNEPNGTSGLSGGAALQAQDSDFIITDQPPEKKKKKKLTMWDQVKDTLGMGEDPLYSSWVMLQQTKIEEDGTISTKDQGQILLSIEMLPEAVAKARPAGFGREAPNAFPTLPPPEGRPDLSKMINPIYLMKTCLGEGLLYKFMGVLCCLGISATFFFAGPAIFDVIALTNNLPYGNWILIGLCVFALMLMCNVIRECRSTCGCGEEDDSDDEDD